jgi:hypothetical protein
LQRVAQKFGENHAAKWQLQGHALAEVPVWGGEYSDETGLSSEQIPDCLLHHIAADFRDRASQGNVLGANLHTILCVATLLNTAVAHEGGQALTFQR